MDFDGHPIVQAVRTHLVRHLGADAQVSRLEGSAVPDRIPALYLARYTPGGPQGPRVYASCGAALHQMPDGRRAEFLFIGHGARLTDEPVLRLLGHMAVHSPLESTPLNVGDVVEATSLLLPLTRADGLMVLPSLPFVQAFRRCETDEGAVDLLWLVPVFEAEVVYAQKHGLNGLMNLFTACRTDLAYMDRGPANTALDPGQAGVRAEAELERAAKKAEAQLSGRASSFERTSGGAVKISRRGRVRDPQADPAAALTPARPSGPAAGPIPPRILGPAPAPGSAPAKSPGPAASAPREAEAPGPKPAGSGKPEGIGIGQGAAERKGPAPRRVSGTASPRGARPRTAPGPRRSPKPPGPSKR